MNRDRSMPSQAWPGGQSRRVLGVRSALLGQRYARLELKGQIGVVVVGGIGGLGNGRNLPLCFHAAPRSGRCSNDAAPLSRSVGSQDRVVARVCRGGHLVWLFSGHDTTHAIAAAGAVVGVEAITKSFLYFAHERLWEQKISVAVVAGIAARRRASAAARSRLSDFSA